MKSFIPASRKEALQLEEPFYFDGSVCRRGHVAKRYASNGFCTECQRLKDNGYLLPGDDVLKYGVLQQKEYDEEGVRVVSYLARQFLPEDVVEAVNDYYRRKR